MKKNKVLLVCLFVINAVWATAQAQKLDGVYVGAQLYSTPYNGMQIENIAVYFRNDGTYTDKLNIKNWKTNVTGKYTISNGIVQFTFDKAIKKYKLSANGNLESTSGIKHTLHKVKNVTTLAAAVYEMKSASNSGGMGTGMPNVGAFSSDYLYFDGKGNFSTDHSGVVGIGGDVAGGTIGGKTNTNSKTRGTYKLSPGEITLTFSNGTVNKHSFFYSPPNEEDMIILDGNFYFRQESEKPVANIKQPVANTNKTQGNATKASGGLPSPALLLSKLREACGGAGIDKITTVKETSAITGNLQAVTFTDIAANKLRVEIRQNGKLLMVKQLEGNDGWQWVNGAKKPLSQSDKTEMTLSLYQGILGLHKKLNKNFLAGTVSESKGDYMLTFFVNNNKLIYMIGSDYKLKANAYTVNNTPNYSVYRDFVEKGGISYPSVTESSDGKNTITVTTTAIEFNPAFTEANWQAP
ncbi:hypothetical protein GCM10023149_44120 [Mucilaginibacter gynuensis]|uniref:Lipocalin-like domain-containing protein n=1 Tax=Mucilaginibacter gynuensis TaxID=1302236 RepID=A0ABP8H8H7_9SPHI